MTCVVRVTCPTCNADIGIPNEKLHSEVHPDHPAANRLVYTCPSCRQPQRHNLTDAQWNWLATNIRPGEVRQVTMPTGIASRFTAGPPPLSEDDLIDFGLELRTWTTSP